MKLKDIKILGVSLLMVAVMIGVAFAVEDSTSRTASGTVSASILFDYLPNSAWNVTAVNATSDLAGTKVTFQGRAVGSPMFKVTSNVVSTATIIQLNSTSGILTNDLLYFKPTALAPGFMVTSAIITATAVTLQAPGIPTNLVTGDVACEIVPIHTIPVGSNLTTGVNLSGASLVKTIGSSPLRAVLTGTAQEEVSITVNKE